MKIIKIIIPIIILNFILTNDLSQSINNIITSSINKDEKEAYIFNRGFRFYWDAFN